MRLDIFVEASLLESFAVVRCAAALPYYCVVNGFAGLSVPQNGGFALVGNAYSGNVGGFNARVDEAV